MPNWWATLNLMWYKQWWRGWRWWGIPGKVGTDGGIMGGNPMGGQA